MSAVCDVNIHIPREPVFDDDLNLHHRDMGSHLEHLSNELRDCGVHAGNVMVLDADMDDDRDHQMIADVLGSGFCRTALIDPRSQNVFERIDRLASLGYQGIKIHPYFQNLADHDFYAAIGVCQYAASKGFWLTLCCSYGTKRVHANHAVTLLGALAQAGVAMPIVALHSGGALVLDVMSIALESPNIYLDTSFSIPFWIGSSIEQDIAFAIRTLGADRCFFGSDRPYQPLGTSIEETQKFLERSGFNDNEIEAVLNSNFMLLKQRARPHT